MLNKKKKEKQTDFSNVDLLNKEDAQRHLDLVKDILENTKSNIEKALGLLKEEQVDSSALISSLRQTKEVSEGFIVTSPHAGGRVIEGVFNGEKMVGADGEEYSMPANYASKSKLVEGDILKLTITKTGSFVYKQIGPIERKQIIGVLVKNESTGDWYAMSDGKRWRLLIAAVTYFHGEPGDEVVILIPKDSKTTWAAVENIIKINNN